MSLMDRAAQPAAEPPDAAEAEPFERPDMRAVVAKVAGEMKMKPAEAAQLQDQVDRIVAAGEKLMYSPDMKDEREQALSSGAPLPQRLAENVAGLVLTLDRMSRGGLPEAAILPAQMELLGEACEFVAHSGQQVTMGDYHEAARRIFVITSEKMGMSPDQIMGVAENAVKRAGGASTPAAPPGRVQTPVAVPGTVNAAPPGGVA